MFQDQRLLAAKLRTKNTENAQFEKKGNMKRET